MATIQFHDWSESALRRLATFESGALMGRLSFTFTEEPAAGGTRTETPAEVNLPLALAGEVQRLEARAVTRRYPAPAARNVEPTRLVLVEFDDSALPWLYTPEPREDGRQRPWLVLLVGREAEGEESRDLTLDASGEHVEVTLEPGLLSGFPLAQSHGWAHIQDLEGERIGRLVSPAHLEPETDYVAVLVPAFRLDGEAWTEAWPAAPTGPVRLRAYDHWRFRTGVQDDFLALARALDPMEAPPGLGRIALRYPRQPIEARLAAGGALAPVAPGPPDPDPRDPWPPVESLPKAVADDLAVLRAVGGDDRIDERGRPILTLPRYGEPWSHSADPHTWAEQLQSDPRTRGAAGLGAELGIADQERLVDQTMQALGPIREGEQRVRHLAMGVSAARSLWGRRLPSDQTERIGLLGLAMPRILTQHGPQIDQVTGPERPLARGLFTSAARRVLRRGPARTALAQPDASRPGEAVEEGNRCPAPDPDPRGLVVVHPAPMDTTRPIDPTVPFNAADPAVASTPADRSALGTLRGAVTESLGAHPGAAVRTGMVEFDDMRTVRIQVPLTPTVIDGGGVVGGGPPVTIPRWGSMVVQLTARSNWVADEVEVRVLSAGLTDWQMTVNLAGVVLPVAAGSASVIQALPTRPLDRVLSAIVEVDAPDALAPGRQSTSLRLAPHLFRATVTPNVWSSAQLDAGIQLEVINLSPGSIRSASVAVIGSPTVTVPIDVGPRQTRTVTATVALPANADGVTARVRVGGQSAERVVLPRPAARPRTPRDTAWWLPFTLYTASGPGRSGEADRIRDELRPWAQNAEATDIDTWGENLEGTSLEGLDEATIRALALSIQGLPKPPVSPDPPCVPVRLTELDRALVNAFDPTGARSRVIERVNGTIPGRRTDAGIRPIGVCPSVPLPVWELLRTHRGDWLLPGLATLAPNAVVSLRTNARFVESLLVGVNQQLLAELAWRGLPIPPGCSPLLRFWGRTDPETGEALDDFEPIARWSSTPLTDPSHRSGDGGEALVVLLRTELFRRYPSTVVYLLPAGTDPARPDFDNPDDHAGLPKEFPVFQGTIGDDVVFFGFEVPPAAGDRHWFVLEEPSKGFRFWSAKGENDLLGEALDTVAGGSGSGGHLARHTFANPIRVMIRGDALLPAPGGAP